MTKYILFLVSIFTFVTHLGALNKYPVNYNKIDSVYSSMSLNDKINSIIISSNNIWGANLGSSITEKDRHCGFVNIDQLYEFCGVNNPMLSDVMIRSAYLAGNNDESINILSNLLIKKKEDGFFFSMKSPYSLLFQLNEQRSNDFFLEPYGRIAIPYELDNGTNKYYIANTYKLPKQVLVSHEIKFNVLNKYSSVSEYDYFSSLHWHDLQRILDQYEEPPLEFILSLGGIIYSNDYTKDYKKLKRIFEKKMLPESILEKSCKKILLYHELCNKRNSVSSEKTLEEDMTVFVNNILRKGCVLLENKDLIPFSNVSDEKYASIHIGVNRTSSFQKMISKYTKCDHFNTENIPDDDGLLKLRKETEGYDRIIVGVNGDWFSEEGTNKMYAFLHQVSEKAELILVHFGSGNRLAALPKGHPFKAILLSFEAGKQSQEIAAQILFGGIPSKGMLAKNINSHFDFGTGFFTDKIRLGYRAAFEKAYTDTLRQIDQIVYKAIRERATPGCQVLVAKDGDIIYNKAFGYHTYNKKHHVSINDLYDIASVTKIVSSVPSVMKMYDEGKLKLEDSLSHFLPRLIGTNKQGIKLQDMLIHQAGLESWIPFYLRTIDKDRLKGDIYNKRYSSQYNIKLDTWLYMNRSVKYRTDIFRHSSGGKFNIKVSDKLYMNYEYLDSIKMGIDTSKVDENPVYRYSDLGYYYIKEIVEKAYDKPLDHFVSETFYKPLGAFKTLYKPLSKYDEKDIVPTEDDKAWRKELVHGYVHDPGAAMLGCVGGHAGVFSSAEDLAKILQMYLNKGSYGGVQYIKPKTIERFTSTVKEDNRRGIGFDKPVLDKTLSGPSCKEASDASFGHSGFTGTLVWVDPEYNLVYVFLSNRIHPNQYNKKLISTDVRTNIQATIYHSLPEYWKKVSDNKQDGE